MSAPPPPSWLGSNAVLSPVQAARDRNVELIVMGAEPPTRTRGGAVLGGLGGSRPAEIGPITEYVLKKAPCRVLITAPPEG